MAFMVDLLKFWKPVALLVALTLAFGAGWYVRKPEVVEKIKTIEIEKQKIDTIKTVKEVVKPDGTTEKTVIEETIAETVSKTTNESDKTVKSLSKYSISAMVEQPIDFHNGFKPQYRTDFGVRVWGPVWWQAGYSFGSNLVGTGVRLEF